jgi:hypothetical protein
MLQVIYHIPLRCIGPILTTFPAFSDFNIPSRHPRVMPATLSSFVPLIMWLSSLLATQTPLASTWKHTVASSSHSDAVTRGFKPGGATCPLVSNVLDVVKGRRDWLSVDADPELDNAGTGTFTLAVAPLDEFGV